jgi:hypothetical protein
LFNFLFFLTGTGYLACLSFLYGFFNRAQMAIKENRGMTEGAARDGFDFATVRDFHNVADEVGPAPRLLLVVGLNNGNNFFGINECKHG